MNAIDVLRDALSRIEPAFAQAIDGLSGAGLVWRPDAEANSIAWLAWHLTKGQDVQISELAGQAPLWTTDGFGARFALPYPADANGYGMSSAEVGEMKPESPELFLEYYRATAARTDAYLGTLSESDLDEVVDRNWTPPVTRGVRIVSVIDDDTQHVGQMAYVRGLWDRRS